MPIQSSGEIKFSELAQEFGVSPPFALSKFYRSGENVPDNGTNANVPSSGQIRLRNFYSAVAATSFFTDNFSTGNFSKTENGFLWTGSPGNVTVESARGVSGSNSAQFRFIGTLPGNDASAERRFDMGALYTELTIMFDLYIPNGLESWGGAAYAHRAESPNNNKFFRLWPIDYNDDTKVGASLFTTTDAGVISKIRSEWTQSQLASIGENGVARAAFINEADLGTWIAVKIYCKASTATTNGTMKIYKNGTLVINNTNTVNNYRAELPEGWRYGYLLGWANSGFDATTYLQIDNVRFYAAVPALLIENFSTYSSTANMLADPRNIYTAEDVNTGQMVLDTSDGYNGLTQCMRYDWPDRSGICSDYTIGRNISFSSPLTEVWVEVVIKLSNAWTTVAAGCSGVSNPDYKFVFGRINGMSSRFDSRIGNSGNNIINGYPGNEAADIVSTTRTDLLDDQWHVFRWHWKVGNGNGISRMWIDGVLESNLTSIDTGTTTNIYGLALGRNINQGPDEIQSLKWGQVRVFNLDPGWLV